ncbi:MAG: GNAT family N-acetyltransferase [Patescibacteria group bacterium]|jgi:GNAT superfamily N-acetyltransferase
MEETISIDLLSTASTQEIAELLELSLQLHVNCSPNFGDWIKEIIDFQTGFLFVARNEVGTIVGMIVLIYYPMPRGYHKAWIEDLIVDASFRGKGIGEKLVKAALDKAKEIKVKTVNLTSRPGREATDHLYQKVGFKKTETNLYRFSFE